MRLVVCFFHGSSPNYSYSANYHFYYVTLATPVRLVDPSRGVYWLHILISDKSHHRWVYDTNVTATIIINWTLNQPFFFSMQQCYAIPEKLGHMEMSLFLMHDNTIAMLIMTIKHANYIYLYIWNWVYLAHTLVLASQRRVAPLMKQQCIENTFMRLPRGRNSSICQGQRK